MAALNPEHLLEQAERLLETKNSLGQVRQVDKRRAISAAYYAVFHFVLTTSADEFVGIRNRETTRYALVYRSIDHGSLERLCKSLSKQPLIEKYLKYIPNNGIGDNIREFSLLFVELKEKRHLADYDPAYRVKISDAKSSIASARSAIERFRSASPSRKKAFLTLLIFPPR